MAHGNAGVAKSRNTRQLISERCRAHHARVRRALLLLNAVEQGLLATVPTVAGASNVSGR
jgi:hypothetical protein